MEFFGAFRYSTTIDYYQKSINFKMIVKKTSTAKNSQQFFVDCKQESTRQWKLKKKEHVEKLESH